MAPASFQGIFPYLVSPVDPATGQVRETVLRRLVDHLIASGVHGLSPLGSTGEFAYLSPAQRAEIVRMVIEAAAGRAPVVPGVAAYSTDQAIRQAAQYVEMGAAGVVLILQAYFQLSRSAVERFYQAVAEAIPCPIVIYTNPSLLGLDIPPAMLVELSHIPSIQYVKDATPNTGRLLTILNAVEGRLKVFAASAHVPLLVFLLGGVGWMAGPACLVPAQCVRLFDLARAGRLEEAWALQRPLWRVNEVFQRYSLAACIKAGLAQQGFDVGPPLAPQEALPRQAVEEIDDVLRRVAELERKP